MQAMIPSHDVQSASRTGIGCYKRPEAKQKARDPSAWPIRHVVKPGSELAKVEIAFAAVTDHAVQGVDRLVSQKAWQSTQQKPEHWRDHTIGEILRQGYNSCPGNSGFVEFPGIAPNNVADRYPTLIQSLLETNCYFRHVIVQTACREKYGTDHADDDPTVIGKVGKSLNDIAGDDGEEDHDRNQIDAPFDLDVLIDFRVAQPVFQPRDQMSHPDNGMPEAAVQPFGIAEQQIQNKGERHGKNADLPAIFIKNRK